MKETVFSRSGMLKLGEHANLISPAAQRRLAAGLGAGDGQGGDGKGPEMIQRGLRTLVS